MEMQSVRLVIILSDEHFKMIDGRALMVILAVVKDLTQTIL